MSQKEKLLNKMSDEDLRASAHSVSGATPGNSANREELVRVLRESLSVREIRSKLRKTRPRTSSRLVPFFLISLVVYSSLVVGLGLISSGLIVAQSLSPDWSRTYRQTSGKPSMTCAQQTSEGGYIFVGTGIILKTDSEGNVQWNEEFAGTAASVLQTSDGGYITGGYTSQYVSWFAKVFSNGTFQWNKTYAPSSNSETTYIGETSDGGYIGVGWMGKGKFIGGTAWLVKMSPLGDIEWNKTIGSRAQNYYPCFVQQISGGRYIVAGTYQYVSNIFPAPIESYFWLARTDLNGNLEWSKTYGVGGYQDAHHARQTSDGGFIIVGDTAPDSYSAGSMDCLLVKTDSEGNAQWKHAYGGSALDTAYFVQQTSDGGYVVAGGTYSFPAQTHSGDEDILLFKTDRYGAMEWLGTFGGLGYDVALFVTELAGDTFAAAGSMFSIQGNLSSEDFFLAQIRKPFAGEAVVTAVVVLLGPLLIIASIGMIHKRERLKTVRKVPG